MQGPSKKKTILIVIGTICAVIILAVGGIALGMRVVSSRQERAAAEEQKAAEAKEKEEQEALAAQQAEQKAREEAEAEAAAEAARAEQQAAIDKAQAEALEGKRENAETLKIVGHATTGNVNEYAMARGGADSGEETQPLAGNNGHKVAIDAGHQAHGNSEKEPIGPGASESKAKVASGTHGDASGLDEYELNLQVALQLRDALTARGYEVYMIRETHDVNISNAERAKAAADAGSEILVRIHANGSDDHSVAGALTMAPGSDNSFLSTDLIQNSQRLSQTMIDSFCAATGAKNLGVQNYNNMSGINWSTIPVTIVEMGFMTNADEDLTMASADYQKKMVDGIANGVDAYFAG